jgi:Pyridoxamine 5'-phosphate oxidase
MEIINLGAGDGLPPVDWAAVTEKLDAGSAPAPDAHNSRTTWLATVNEDGSPHVTAVGALWLDGAFWFQTGSGTRKGLNVARDPRCSIAVSIRDADVVIEGDAARVTDPAIVARIAKAWADNGWPAEPDESGSGITRAVQRTISRTAAVVRVSHRATLGDCRVGHRAGRPNSLQVLTPGGVELCA